MKNLKIWVGATTSALAAGLAVIACGSTGSESIGARSQELIQLPANGNVTTVAGTGTPGAADNAVAKSGTFNDPAGVAVASDGSIFIADWANNSVRRVSAGGALSTVAKGSPNLILNPRGEAPGATQAVPVPQWTVTSGTWLIGTRTNGCVDPCASPFDGSKWISGKLLGGGSSITQVIDLSAYRTAIAASRIQGAFSASYRGGLGLRGAHIKVEYLDANGISRTTFDSGQLPINGTAQTWLTVSDQRAVSPSAFSARITLFTDFQQDTGFDALQLRMIDTTAGANDRLLSGPSAVAVSSAGDLWVGANGIWRGDVAGAALAKIPDVGGYVAPKRVSSIAPISDGYIYFADPSDTKLHVRSPAGIGYYANSHQPWTDQIVAVAGVDRGAQHRIYVAFRNTTRVEFYDCNKATTFMTADCLLKGAVGSTRGFVDDMDGTAGGERFGYVNALAVGKFGDLFVGEESNHSIRRTFSPLTQTSAGGGVPGFVDNVVSTAARFSSPSGVAVTSTGNVIVADRINNRIRSISCSGINVCGAAVAGCTMTPTDDQNACTADTCMLLGVNHDPLTGTSCTDNNACTSDPDKCNAGSCQPGAPKNTNDGNACTTDACNIATGDVTNVPVNISDNNACTTDSCDSVSGTINHVPVPVTDNDLCTTDTCDPVTGTISHSSTFTDTNLTDCLVPVCNPATGNVVNGPAAEGMECGAADSGRLCNQASICETAAPQIQAPTLATATSTPFGASTSFIYEGANRVQTGSTANYIDKTHAGWIVGYVKTASGNPMSNVVVIVAGNSNYGQTLTRSDGRFDLVVNGGTTHTLRFSKSGHFGADRRVYVGWEQTAALEDVVLLTPDSKSTVVTPNSGAQQVVIGSSTSGVAADIGTRTPIVVMPASTKVFVDGVERTASITLRLTEYTTGANGRQRMPAPLPPTTGYTYAVEISADEAMSATRIEFKDSATGSAKDAFVYLEDFVGFAAGLPACITQCAGATSCINACRTVPSGYYDRSKLAWVGSKSGRIMKIKSVTGGIATVDVTGDNVADSVLTDSQFASLKFTSAELATLGGRYTVDTALWRVPIDHMTPYDFNSPVVPDCADGVCPTPPPAPPAPPGPSCGSCCGDTSGQAGTDNLKEGSIIGCDSQSLGETAEVAGTPYALHYSSRRMPGYAEGRQTRIALTGAQVHSQAALIEVRVAVAGQRREKLFIPVAPATTFAPNLSWTFTWDGLDGAGREVVGSSIANITVTTFYRARYIPNEFFGSFPSPTAVLTDSPRAFYPLSVTRDVPLMGRAPDQAWSLGGWTFDRHHFYDVPSDTLWLGSGGVRPSAAAAPTITRLITGLNKDIGGVSGGGIAVAPNGDIFVADINAEVIRRLSPNGATSTIVGDGSASCPNGLDGPSNPNDNLTDATLAHLMGPKALAVGPDGSLYVVGDEQTVRKATPKADGTGKYSITTVAGVACKAGNSTGVGDNGPAVSAKLERPIAIALGPDGSIYIAESFRVRRIDASGIITTVAGTGSGGLSGGDRANEGKLAKTVPVGGVAPYGVAVSTDGTLYIGDGYALQSVDRNGWLHYLNRPFLSTQAVGDGVPLKGESIDSLGSLAIRPDGSVVFNDRDGQRAHPGHLARSWLRSVDTAGIVTSLAVTNENGDPAPARGLAIGNGPPSVVSLAAAPDGSVVALSNNNLYRIDIPKPAATECNDVDAKYQVHVGNEDHCFDSTGRHLKTIDPRTGQALITFQYANGLLAGVTDRVGQKTTISKLTGPPRYEILAPFQQKTTIGLESANGYATSIADALGQLTLVPLANGLLDSLRDRRNNLFDFTFDDKVPVSNDDRHPTGLLIADASPIGTQTLSRILLSNGRVVTHKTPKSRETTYETVLDMARVLKHTTTFPDLSTELRQSFPSGTQKTTTRDGTTIETALALDPALSTQPLVPSIIKVTLPSQLLKTTQEVRAAPTNITGGKSIETRILYGAASDAPFTKTTWAYSTTAANLPGVGAAQQIVVQSPEGRKTTRLLDKAGRTISHRIGSLTPVVSTYETTTGAEHIGTLKTTAQGLRTTGFKYRDKGDNTAPADAGYLLQKIGRYSTTEFERDLFGRIQTQLEAKGTGVNMAGTTTFSWDKNGNLESLKPPSSNTTPPEHLLGYNGVNLLSTYTPPSLAGIFDPKTTYDLNSDRDIDSETRPKELAGSTPVKVARTYITATGQLDTISFAANGTLHPAGNVNYDYFTVNNSNGSAAGRVSGITGPYGVSTSSLYDGPLLTKMTWSGDIVGNVLRTYNNNFLQQAETVSPAPAVGPAAYTFAYDNDQLLVCASGAAVNPCNPSTLADLLLARSTDHGMVTEISVGVSGTPPTATVVERIEYSDTTPDNGETDTDGPNGAFGELRRQSVKFSGTPIADIVYDTPTEARDDLGRIRFKTETFGGVTNEIEYQYDERDRLEFVQTGLLTESFEYDLNGNRTKYISPSGTPLIGVYDAQDRLTTYGSAAGTAVGDLTFTYGPNGELKTKVVKTATASNTWTFGYDPLGNLVTVARPGTSNTTYTYLVDGQGRRVGKKEKIGSAAETVKKRWLYRDGLNPVAELSSTGAIQARYVYGSRPNVPDLVIKGAKTYRIIVDQLGSPRMAVNVANSADVPYRVDYSAFGVPTWKGTGAAATAAFDWIPFGFAGGIYDPDTGLVRFGVRDYDASVGRWVSKDPSRFRGGINLYAYAWNDPVNFRDRTGRRPTGAGGASNSGEGGGEGSSGTGAGPSTPVPGMPFDLPFGPSRDEHANRNSNNRCPEHPPSVCGGGIEDDFSYDEMFGKYRGSAGNECAYDSNGKLLPDPNQTFNFYPDPYTAGHGWSDFGAHYWYGGGDGYSPDLTTSY